MTFVRTKITSTNDTAHPRVVHLGSDVIWYVYRRVDRGLYLQRESAGVRSAEVLIATPVDALDVIVDPDDIRAWIYFVTDGSLRALQVTDKTETPTVQAVQRNAGWYVRSEFTVAAGSSGTWTTTSITPPAIALVEVDLITRAIVTSIPTLAVGRVAFVRVYRMQDHDGLGWQPYGSPVLVPFGAPYVVIEVPATNYPFETRWAVTSIRLDPSFDESAFSNIQIDLGTPPGDLIRGRIAAGAHSSWTLVDKTPVKLSGIPDTSPVDLGSGTGATWTLVDKPPVKYAGVPDSYANVVASGVDASWILDGSDVLNP